MDWSLQGRPGVAACLRSLGYQQHSIEQTIRNENGTICVPEFIAFSRKLAHTIVFEWKSGNNTEDDQLARYSSLTSKSLTDVGMVDRTAAKSFDVAVVCPLANADRIKIGIEKGKYAFPLLAVGVDGISLVHNRFRAEPLNGVFLPKLQINMATAPLGHVPVSGTSEFWEVASVMVPLIVEKMRFRETVVKASSLCPLVFTVWDNMMPEARRQSLRRISEVLEQASLCEFKNFWTYTKQNNNDCQINIVNNPLAEHASKRSGAYKKLRNLQRQFVERLVKGDLFKSELYLFDPPPLG